MYYWFVIDLRGFTFDFSVTATVITAGHITVRNERLIFCTFIVSGKVTATIYLVIAPVVIRVHSALMIRAPSFPRLLLLIAVLVRVSIRRMV